MKLSFINEKVQKIEEAAKIREEQNLNFSKQTEAKLIMKMESNKENRAALMNQLMEKLKKTVEFLWKFQTVSSVAKEGEDCFNQWSFAL